MWLVNCEGVGARGNGMEAHVAEAGGAVLMVGRRWRATARTDTMRGRLETMDMTMEGDGDA